MNDRYGVTGGLQRKIKLFLAQGTNSTSDFELKPDMHPPIMSQTGLPLHPPLHLSLYIGRLFSGNSRRPY